MKYVSVDIETSGLDPEYCQVLEVGAVIDDLSGQTCPDHFHCYVLHDRIVGQPFALQMNAAILAKIAEPQKHPDETFLRSDAVAGDFRYWLRCNGVNPDDPINVAGKNFARFDQKFLDRLPNWASNVRVRSRVLDPAILYFRPDLDDALPGLSTCLKRAGLDDHVSHRAVDDALAVVRLLRRHYGLAV